MYFDRIPFSKRDRFGQIRDIFRKSWQSHHASWIIELFCVIKWPFYDPPLAYLIRTDYTITAVNSIPSCGLLVASKFWRVVTKKKRREKKEKKVQRNGQRVEGGEGWILSCFRAKGVKRLSRGRCLSSVFRVCWKPDYRGTV